MNRDDLIRIWQEGNERLHREEKTQKALIMKYLNQRTMKGTRGIRFTIVFYGFIQVANLILLALNLQGYINNITFTWILIPQLIITIGILVFGIDIYYRFREINNYSESLHILITKQLRFFRKPYELWLFLSALSIIILATNINLYIDNDNGSYTIYNWAVYVGVTLAVFLIVYGALKASTLHSLRSLRAYLSDLQKGTLDMSQQLERSRKKLVWLYAAILVLLTASVILGLYMALY